MQGAPRSVVADLAPHVGSGIEKQHEAAGCCGPAAGRPPASLLREPRARRRQARRHQEGGAQSRDASSAMDEGAAKGGPAPACSWAEFP